MSEVVISTIPEVIFKDVADLEILTQSEQTHIITSVWITAYRTMLNGITKRLAFTGEVPVTTDHDEQAWLDPDGKYRGPGRCGMVWVTADRADTALTQSAWDAHDAAMEERDALLATYYAGHAEALLDASGEYGNRILTDGLHECLTLMASQVHEEPIPWRRTLLRVSKRIIERRF